MHVNIWKTGKNGKTANVNHFIRAVTVDILCYFCNRRIFYHNIKGAESAVSVNISAFQDKFHLYPPFFIKKCLAAAGQDIKIAFDLNIYSY